jgi:hypothetical protein
MHVRVVAAVLALGLWVHPQLSSAQNMPDVEALLYSVADTLGMLRTPREVDRLATMIYSGTGTTTIDNETCEFENYRSSVRYPIPSERQTFAVPGMRVDIRCERSDGELRRYIQVVAGETAWNETEPGLNATPAPETVRERLLQVWLLPQGLVKAAVAAGPRTIATTEGGNPILTFPLPAPLEDIVVSITLDPEVFLYHTMPTGIERGFSHRIERVETRFDGAVVDVHYSDYRDWNEADYKADVLLPGRIVQTRNGTITLDLTLSQSNTYNPYVVMPVPESISADGAGVRGQ